MGESEGELVRVSRRAVATRVGLWMNPMNGDVCVYERERERERESVGGQSEALRPWQRS